MFRNSFSGLGFLAIVVTICVLTAYFQKKMRVNSSEQISADVSARFIEDEGVAVASIPDVKKEEKKAVEFKPAALPKIDRKPVEEKNSDVKKVEADKTSAEAKPNLKPVVALNRDLVDDGQLKSRWIDSLSGRHARMDFAIKSKKEDCSIQNPCEKHEVKEVNLAGIVIDTDELSVDGELDEGNFMERTPAVYLK